MQNLYGIQLLDDIHAHFPDILYNPSRFQTVKHVLDYIREVAMQQSPYVRGITNYNLNTRIPPPPPPPRAFPSDVPVRIRVETQEIPNNGAATVLNGTFDIPLTTSDSLTEALLNPNSLLYRLFTMQQGDEEGEREGVGEGGRAGASSTFENVIVRPTNAHIAEATSLVTTTTSSETICAICQDPIECGATVRKINACNHMFHRTCIDMWFTSNVRCPICRHDIRG